MSVECDRYWLLTWTTYGTWLPGDWREFVSPVRVGPGPEVRHNTPGTPHDRGMPALQASARQALKCPPIYLNQAQAHAVLDQFQATAQHRGWQLLSVAIMTNHVHVVLGVPGDPSPSKMLGDLKSYGSRALNGRWPKPASDTWWTESGSKRKLSREDAILAAAAYVRDQAAPLVVWTHPHL